MLGLVQALWRYRGFVFTSIRNELVARFSRSILGGFWMILQPLSQVLIFALILSAVLRAKLPGIDGQFASAIYLTAGILGWSLF
ncbi:MAG: ABC transporter permease, partial [Proteobacteria bacterium]|nr:ABC transporter permease [Pseudomonadota bacterium]